MRKVLLWSIVLVLATAGTARAAGPEPKTEEQKTLYALGLALSQNLAVFNLSESELAMVESGLSDGILHKDKKVDLQTYGPKIQQLHAARLAALADTEKKAGQAFAAKAAQDKNTTKTADGLVMTTLKPGTGASPKPTDTVKVHYQGTLTDGTIFDSSVQRGEPVTFPLSSMIKCWTEALPMMKVGGKSRLVCPSDLAYGDRGAPPKIKPGATLVFEVELLDIVKNEGAATKPDAGAKK